MLKTKSIYDLASEEDGLRVLVTRYWPRGVKKERSDLWFRDLGPLPVLIRAWKSRQVTWAEFRALYIDEFSSTEKREAFERADSMIKGAETASGKAGATVTLLCTCRDTAHCHRGLLKDLFER